MGAAARGRPRGETCEVREPSEKGRTEWVRATAMRATWLNEGVVRVWPSRERGWIRSGEVQGRVSRWQLLHREFADRSDSQRECGTEVL